MQTVTPPTSGDHPLLAEILEAVAQTGTYSKHWGTLRRAVFPGESGWKALQAWSASHSLDCQLCFGESSRSTDVLFRRQVATARS
jgi:hypothetical protein